jgi:hypothetical protein
MEPELCPATMRFGDDYGDNTTTFHCDRPTGHKGLHMEKSVMHSMAFKDDSDDFETTEHPYRLTWPVPMPEDDPEEE